MEQKLHIGLVLQGGGALGAYECGAVKALEEQFDHFTQKLDVVSGVSIGAVNAAVLVGARKDNPVKALEDLWLNHLSMPDVPFVPLQLQPLFAFRGMWGTPGMCYIRPELFFMPWMINSCYDTTPLLQTLERLVDIEKINKTDRHLLVGASNLETGEFTWFKNQNGRRFSYDMVRASGALMPSFSPIRLADQETGRVCYYCDGGYLYNLPLLDVVKILGQEQYRDGKRLIIIVELFPMEGEAPLNILEAQNRATQLSFSSRVQMNTKFFEALNAYSKLAKLLGNLGVDKVSEHLSAVMRVGADSGSGFQQIPSFQQASEELELAGSAVNQVKDEINKDPEMRQAYDVLQAYNVSRVDNRPQTYDMPQAYGLPRLYSSRQEDDFIEYLVITPTRPEPSSGGGDFSRGAIERRIERGYQDTYDKLKNFKESM